jgi:hypothetical protein
VDLAVAKLGGFGDEGFDVGWVKYIAGNGDCLAAVAADGFNYLIGLFYGDSNFNINI